ncbi:tetratricopeptide repeat protein [Paludisphaera rhizosphaerae]|uniref:tetratricopeptide repeat protein n=1 Tax=Paludisphaera rhizosphaerae TaxID=2711216 RepID=UPI0013EC1EA6|nr:tetratricopeptide repeat protein [Paludisphaera rhizosphaerae]
MRIGFATTRTPVLLGLILASVMATGCHGRRREEHASAKLLDGATIAHASRRQTADVQVAMGRTLEQTGDFKGAEAAYREALAKDRRRGDAEARLAVLAEQAGDSKRADEHFARALKLDPRDPDLLCDHGYALYLRGEWEKAEAAYRRALAEDPRHARAHNNMGLALARKGERDAALAEFAAAGCDPADARSNLALAMAMEGRMEDARELYAEALASKPDSLPARDGLRAAGAVLASRDRPPVAGVPATATASATRRDSAVARASAPGSD